MKYIWSPWRMEFIEKVRRGRGCIFCKFVRSRNREIVRSSNKDNLILYFGKHCFAMMNKYPYNNGHLMIVPYEHKAEICSLKSEVQHELVYLTGKSVCILKKTLKCAGANCGMNIGRAAGAGIEGHVHMHVVPRWAGDSNFMPIIGGTKSMPEYLKTTYKRLKPEFDKI